jgi:predicted DNA-binding protein (UPF0278 family)
MAKYLVPKETFNCNLGVRTLWEQLEYEVSVEKPEVFGIKIPLFFTKEYIKKYFDIIEK